MYNIPDDPYSVLAARGEFRNDAHPAMSLGRADTQEFLPRSKRAAPARRGAGARSGRAEESRQFESNGDKAKVRELELQLELMKLKQAHGNEEAQAQVGEDEEDEW